MKKIQIAPPVNTTMPAVDGTFYQFAVCHGLDVRDVESGDLAAFREVASSTRQMVKTNLVIPKWISVGKTEDEDRGFWHQVLVEVWIDEGTTPQIILESKPAEKAQRGDGE